MSLAVMEEKRTAAGEGKSMRRGTVGDDCKSTGRRALLKGGIVWCV